jgi:hypothetical protein
MLCETCRYSGHVGFGRAAGHVTDDRVDEQLIPARIAEAAALRIAVTVSARRPGRSLVRQSP